MHAAASNLLLKIIVDVDVQMVMFLFPIKKMEMKDVNTSVTNTKIGV